MSPERPAGDRRVLLLAPTTRDGNTTRDILASAGIGCVVCQSMNDVCRLALQGAAAAIVTEESVQSGESEVLIRFIEQQPVWSDLPIIVLARAEVESPAVEWAIKTLGNVSLIERPMRVSMLISVVKTALRARERQYQVRGYLLEQKETESALVESEQKFRGLAESIPQLAWMANADGAIFWYNRRWYDYTGTTFEQMQGWGWQSVHDSEHLSHVLEVWKATLQTGVPFEMEFPLKAADGKFRWFLTRVAPLLDHNGKISLWIGTNTDIEDRRRIAVERARLLEAERAARIDAERSSQMKDEFLATLSHELRTPLNAILGWSQILAGGTCSAEDLNEGLKTIERNARAQTQIIEDLLDMSRIIAGKVRLDVQRIELAPVIQGAIETVKPAADAKGIRIQSVLDPLAGPISGDPNRLQQVFWNLLTNAIKFTHKGGRVQVLLERINSHIEVSVIDTGEGINPEFLPFMFERFRQADATTTRRHGGLGLGLAIVKQLVELHGGTIRAKSPGAGAGSTFIISLPMTVVHPEPTPETLRRHPVSVASPVRAQEFCKSLKGVKVLVVDDEPDARALVKRLLEDCEAIVTIAASAAEAFNAFAADTPDVIVSDVGMPMEDGYSLIQRIRASGPDKGGNVPAVALTAYARSEDRMKSVVAGFQYHLAKPVEPAELITVVASLAKRDGSVLPTNPYPEPERASGDE